MPTLLGPGAGPAATSTLIGPAGPAGAPLAGLPDGSPPGRPFSASPPLGLPPILGAGRPRSTPFSAPPWQSGRAPSERPARPWSIVELPAIDPELFARQRRIVVRVAAALGALVILLALLAGHC